MTSEIRAHANCDDVYVAWRVSARIDGCRGFALWRQRGDDDPEPVRNRVTFSDEPPPQPGQDFDSNEKPFQRFMWTDGLVKTGDVVRYRAVPIVRDGAGTLVPVDEQATPWSEQVTVSPAADPGLSAWFNRGVLATQSLARRLGASEQPWRKQLTTIIAEPDSPIRQWLGGELRTALLRLLAQTQSDGGSVRAALFELDDPELAPALERLGDRAEVVLANGTDAKGDENAQARKALRDAGVTVHDRMTGSRLAHNKFLVFRDAADEAAKVWTGSTNWTKTGLCTQVNNAVLIDNPETARIYDEHWDALVAAGNDFPRQLVDGDNTANSAVLDDGASASVWFTPTNRTLDLGPPEGRRPVDLADARERINAATEGILLLMFNPGREHTLLNDIMARATTDGSGPYIHGVVNQDPQAGSKDPASVGLIHRGQLDAANPDIVLPAAVDERFAGWSKEIRSYNIVMVHSKVIVIDPFGAKPVVMTGSHNLGHQASTKNDDNLAIIENAPKLAAAYAVNIIAVYNAYRWRYVRSQKAHEAGKGWTGLVDADTWQDGHFAFPLQRELGFWLGDSA